MVNAYFFVTSERLQVVISALTSGKFYRLPPDKENPVLIVMPHQDDWLTFAFSLRFKVPKLLLFLYSTRLGENEYNQILCCGIFTSKVHVRWSEFT